MVFGSFSFGQCDPDETMTGAKKITNSELAALFTPVGIQFNEAQQFVVQVVGCKDGE